MSANPFMITAVGRLHNFDKDQELYADELAVLRRKLRALKEALNRHTMTADNESDAAYGRYMLHRLNEYDVNLATMNRLKKRIEVVGFVDDMELLDAKVYGEEVAQKATEFLRYWEHHAQPGTQV